MGYPEWTLRLWLAVLGLAWSAGCLLYFRRLLDPLRGTLLAAGMTFCIISAQFAGYMETSGMITAFIPWLLLALTDPGWSSGLRRLALYSSIIGIAGAFHGSSFCLAPALALASAPENYDAINRKRLWIQRCAVLIAGLFIAFLLSRILLWMLGNGLSATVYPISGGPEAIGKSLTPLTRAGLHYKVEPFSRYTMFSVAHLWDFSNLWGIAGAAMTALLALSMTLKRDQWRRCPPLSIALLSMLAFEFAWNYDWGMFHDWNLALPWLVASSIAACALAREQLRSVPIGAIALLAISLAATGVLFTVNNHLNGLKAWQPDVSQWSATSGRVFHAELLIEDKLGWNVRTLPQKIIVTKSGERQRISLNAWQFYNLILDRLEIINVRTGEIAAGAEAEQIAQAYADQSNSTLNRNTTPVRGWGIANDSRCSQSASAEASRTTSSDPIHWELKLPPGEYQLRIRGFFTPDNFPSAYCALQWRLKQR
ncbi:hypothetical protein JXA32_14495 [Candidatus Sumerlaeota bacterium]|nr:hypothetical protein [Candidatus Sumerlaeota bacterium]